MASKRVSLGKIGDLRQGLTLSRYLDSGGVPRRVLQVANLDGMRVVKRDDRVESMDMTRIKEHEVRPEQVLLSLRGSVLKAAVVPDDMDDAVVSNSLVIFDLDRKKADPYFIAGLLNSEAMQSRVSTLFTGTTIQGIPLSRFKQVQIELPPLEEQSRFAEAFRALANYDAAMREVLRLRDQELKAHLQKFVIREQA